MSVMAALAEKVASDTGNSAYRVRAPHDASLPYAVIEMVDTEVVHHLGGRSGAADSSVAIEVFAATPSLAETEADAVESGIDGQNQSIGTGGDAINVTIRQTGRAENMYEARDASRADIYSVRMSFDVWHTI